MTKWIHVEEKRPDLGMGVLIYLKSGFITVGYRTMKNDDFFWQLFGDTEFIVPNNDEVSHWMTLPAPPKFGKEK